MPGWGLKFLLVRKVTAKGMAPLRSFTRDLIGLFEVLIRLGKLATMKCRYSASELKITADPFRSHVFRAQALAEHCGSRKACPSDELVESAWPQPLWQPWNK